MTDDPQEVAYDALREMYSEAEPGLDFDDVLNNPDEYGENWFTEHTLSKERQNEIVEKHIDEADLTDEQEVSVHWTAILNHAPSYGISNDD